MRKRLLGFLICVMLVSMCVGCGAESANAEQTETVETTTTKESTPKQTAEPTATPEETEVPSEEVVPETETPDATPEPIEEPTPEPTIEPVPEPQVMYTYTDITSTMYATQTVNIRNLPSTDGEKIGSLSTNQEITVIGQCNETSWYMFDYNGQTAFVSNSYLSTEKVEVQQSTGGGGGNSWAAQFGVTLPFTATVQVATEGITHHLLWNHPTSFDPDTNLICHFWNGTQVTISDFATYRSWPMAYVTLPDGTSGWALFYDGAGCYFTW